MRTFIIRRTHQNGHTPRSTHLHTQKQQIHRLNFSFFLTNAKIRNSVKFKTEHARVPVAALPEDGPVGSKHLHQAEINWFVTKPFCGVHCVALLFYQL